ncbi:MAG: TraR/DksA C4-type zinc finger protein [Candidatus Parcubacteria bacterium]|nr:TraR/DksA C4-type zinc finger protein [Candidatus Parcubacteria bacterium]
MKLQILTELPYNNKRDLIKFLKTQKFDYKMSARNNPADKSAAWRHDRIVKALVAIAESTKFRLGYCVKCNREIPLRRLLVEPETIWCIECAKKMEQKAKKTNWFQKIKSRFQRRKQY